LNTPRTKFYLDKVGGKFMGVCAGIADYTGIEVMWVRVGVVLLTLAGMGGITIPAYFLVGLFAEKKPSHLYASRQEERFWQGVRQSPGRTAREVRARFRDIDRRLADIEQYYVSSNPRLAAEIERLR
jgi:phage shock protein C